ncbi:hypothetical protein HELRODRAFT_165704 [Helobdella robusta]|uniref:Uncharacterized protein n=1 Tax=Helobdella robusta TaxID=6412 RepID=T1EX70_HELRO|nr:hypothetical protein HELRODRAFT_165704 [Helobdella robusta]ESN91651.1 hypothetical protein HELRODRAFT_165704 [Helobdella robusta]
MPTCKKDADCKIKKGYRISSLDSDTSSISLSKIASEVSICRSKDVQKMKQVHPVYASYTAPGPNAYPIKSCTGYKDHDPTKTVMPAYSFFRDVRFRDPPKPPEPFCEIDCTKHVCFKCCTIPKYVPIEKVSDVPAPNTYNLNPGYQLVEKQSPKYTFGYRLCDKINITPGPNEYCITCGSKYYPWSAGFSMGIRDAYNSYLRDICKTPAIQSVNSSCVLRRAPSYSIGKILAPLVKEKSPGPGAYKPECVTLNKERHPQYSFGKRHSKYKITPIVLS